MKITKTPLNTLTIKIIEGYNLIKPRRTKSEEKADWQHPTPHPTKTNTFTQHTDSQTQETQQHESEELV